MKKKPDWIKIKLPINHNQINIVKERIHSNKLKSVCEEASCPNIYECFSKGHATFMILGKYCTRNCAFCNVSHSKPLEVDVEEPKNLSEVINKMNLNYVVITSVNRDDLIDGGAQHFVNCINAIRKKNKNIKIEILVPDFRRCIDYALKIINSSPPDVFNHNIETVPRLYKQVRSGSNYYHSLSLLRKFKEFHPKINTKSGIMLGLGEEIKEVFDVMKDLRNNGVTMLTVGQYLRPSINHLPVKKFFHPTEFKEIEEKAISLKFTHVYCGPLVRSSYNADIQYKNIR